MMRPLVVVVVMCAALPAVAQPCVSCWNDTCPEMKSYLDKCEEKKKAPKPKTTAPKVETPQPNCEAGKTRGADTMGNCCWPGQAWNGDRCVGAPSACPADHVVDGETCALPMCSEGKVRAVDGLHCCWPGQGYSISSAQCVGAPSCPGGFLAENGTCVSPREQQARIEAQQAAQRAAQQQQEDQRWQQWDAQQAAAAQRKAQAREIAEQALQAQEAQAAAAPVVPDAPVASEVPAEAQSTSGGCDWLWCCLPGLLVPVLAAPLLGCGACALCSSTPTS